MLCSFLILRRLDSHTTLQRLKAEREPQVVEESRSQLEALEGEGGAGEGEEMALVNGTQEAERDGAWTLRVTDREGAGGGGPFRASCEQSAAKEPLKDRGSFFSTVTRQTDQRGHKQLQSATSSSFMYMCVILCTYFGCAGSLLLGEHSS